MSRHYTVIEIKTAIADVIRAVAPNAVVHERQVLQNPNQKEWPAEFHSDNDLDASGKPRTHGYMVEFTGSPPSERARANAPADEVWDFVIFGLIKQRRDDASSQATLSEIMAISGAFRYVTPMAEPAKTKLQYVLTYQDVYDTKLFGGELCHYLTAKLTLRPC